VQKWIILVKNSNSNTTIGKTRYLSAILRKCMEENCLLLRIDSSNPCKVTGLVDGSMIQGAFCARMEGSAWGWLGEKAIDYMAELRRMAAAATVAGAGAAGGGAAAEADQPALTVQSDQALEEDLLAIAKGKGAQTL
jgi:hypothetical protein